MMMQELIDEVQAMLGPIHDEAVASRDAAQNVLKLISESRSKLTQIGIAELRKRRKASHD